MHSRELITRLVLMATILAMPAHALAEGASEVDSTLTTLVLHNDSNLRTSTARPRPYDNRIHRYRRYWANLIPTQLIIQNAGNMGLVSAGLGWDYGGHRQWETHLLIGFIPKYESPRAKFTFTLKQTYIPWSRVVGHDLSFEPLTCGLYFNTVAGHEFWKEQPHRYPDKYYAFLSTRFRLNVFLGQRLTKVIPDNSRKFVKSITAFYEVSTCDLYIRSAFIDDKVKISDIVGLSLGIKLQLL